MVRHGAISERQSRLSSPDGFTKNIKRPSTLKRSARADIASVSVTISMICGMTAASFILLKWSSILLKWSSAIQRNELHGRRRHAQATIFAAAPGESAGFKSQEDRKSKNIVIVIPLPLVDGLASSMGKISYA